MGLRKNIEGIIGKVFKIGLGADEVAINADAGKVGIGEVLPGAQLHIGTSVSSRVGLIVKGVASQASDLLQWKDDAGNLLGSIDANGRVSFGKSANTPIVGQISQASGQFASLGDSQTSTFILRRQTTDATVTELTLDGLAPGAGNRAVLSDDTTYHFDIQIVARRTDANDESAAYRLEFCMDRNVGSATTALVGSVTKTVVAEDTAAWDVSASADTVNGSVKITVTGEAAKTIRWVAFVRMTEVSG